MRITKTDMARVIVQALYAMSELPATDDRRVKRLAGRPLSTLEPQHKLAVTILSGATVPETGWKAGIMLGLMQAEG